MATKKANSVKIGDKVVFRFKPNHGNTYCLPVVGISKPEYHKDEYTVLWFSRTFSIHSKKDRILEVTTEPCREFNERHCAD